MGGWSAAWSAPGETDPSRSVRAPLEGARITIFRRHFPPELTHGNRRRQDPTLHRARGDRRRRPRDLSVLRPGPGNRHRDARVQRGMPIQRPAGLRAAAHHLRSLEQLRRTQEPEVLRHQLSQRGDLPGARHGAHRGGPVQGARAAEAGGDDHLQHARRIRYDVHGGEIDGLVGCWNARRAPSRSEPFAYSGDLAATWLPTPPTASSARPG